MTFGILAMSIFAKTAVVKCSENLPLLDWPQMHLPVTEFLFDIAPQLS
jgi:hypothetical protein